MTKRNTLRNVEAFRRVLPYAEMREDGWFPRPTIYPHDIDGEVEYEGHFLYFEWKEIGATVEKAEWSADSKRLWLLGERGTCFYVYHEKGNGSEILPADVRALRIARRDSWLIGEKLTVKLTENAIACNWLGLHEWVTQWGRHVDEKPNSFVSDFRKLGPFREAELHTPFWEL